MAEKQAQKIIPLDKTDGADGTVRESAVDLASGRTLVIGAGPDGAQGEEVRIVERDGAVSCTIALTDAGPVVTVTGARLCFEAAESIELEADRVAIRGREAADIQSDGTLDVSSKKDMTVHAGEEVRVTGKMIHLN